MVTRLEHHQDISGCRASDSEPRGKNARKWALAKHPCSGQLRQPGGHSRGVSSCFTQVFMSCGVDQPYPTGEKCIHPLAGS